jgi:hypothetical protein
MQFTDPVDMLFRTRTAQNWLHLESGAQHSLACLFAYIPNIGLGQRLIQLRVHLRAFTALTTVGFADAALL